MDFNSISFCRFKKQWPFPDQLSDAPVDTVIDDYSQKQTNGDSVW